MKKSLKKNVSVGKWEEKSILSSVILCNFVLNVKKKKLHFYKCNVQIKKLNVGGQIW